MQAYIAAMPGWKRLCALSADADIEHCRSHTPVSGSSARELVVANRLPGHLSVGAECALYACTMKPEAVTRSQVLGYRLRANHLDQRLGRRDVEEAAYAGLQDSVPRSALLSLHARVEDVDADAWEDPDLVQVWGPRGSVYVVPKMDFAVFTLGRLPRDAGQRRGIEEDARRIRDLLEVSDRPGLKTVTEGSVRRVREAAATGTIRIRWDGSSIDIWAAEPPDADVEACRRELARRYLMALAPSSSSHFATWAGIDREEATGTWKSLQDEMVDVRIKGSVRQALAESADSLIGEDAIPDTTRLLPPGDPYLLARDREAVVPDSPNRSQLWPQGNVPPGGLLVEGDLAGTWRRRFHSFTITPWQTIGAKVKEAVQAEVAAMPSLGTGEPKVRWTSG